ncbi:MAG: hypothetical protein V4688_09360 [Pseudomonadota bacterium]
MMSSVAAERREPVGAVLDVSRASSMADGKSTAIELFEYLYDQQRIRVAEEGKLVLSLSANRTDYVIKGPAVVRVGTSQLIFESGKVFSSKARPDVVVSALLAGPRTQGAVRLRASRGVLPTSGSVVTSNRPVLSWPALAGQGDYELRIADGNGDAEQVYLVSATRWQPDEKQALAWGHAYRWRAKAADTEAVGVSGNFTVISDIERDQLAQLLPAGNASFAERVVYAKTLEHLGVRDEAKVIWQALSAERPDNNVLKEYLKANP